MRKYLKRISRVLEQPKVLLGLCNGVRQTYCFYCLTVQELLKENPKTIIDVGASQGEFADACRYLFPDAKIYAFEPCPKHHNKLSNKVDKLFKFGLGDINEKDKLFYFQTEGGAGASSFLKHKKEWFNLAGGEKEIIKSKADIKRFDSLNLKIERPCYLKIDTEGFDDRVLFGFGDKLKEVDIIQVEWFFKEYYENQMKLSNILPLLEKYGFVGFIQKAVNVSEDGPTYCDLVFFKNQEKN